MIIAFFEEITQKNWLNIIESISSILGSLGIFILTLYAFWLYHFSKKIKITSFGSTHSRFKGSGLNCSIYNKTMSPKTIESISVVYDNKYIVTLIKFDMPFLLEPFHAYYIEGKKYSIEPPIPVYKDIYFILKTPEKTIYVKFRGRIKKNKNLETVMTFSNSFNGEVISDTVKYALMYWFKNEATQHCILIDQNGCMDKAILDFNVLPKNILNDSKKMSEFFKRKFTHPDVKFKIYNIGTNK